MSKQNYLTIFPCLQISTFHNPEAYSYGISLRNHGVEPAILESISLEFKASRHNLADHKDELFRFLATVRPELDSLDNFTYGTLNQGIAIPANTSYDILTIEQSPEDYRMFLEALNQRLQDGLRVQVVYKSIQDEHWMIQNDSKGPEKLD